MHGFHRFSQPASRQTLGMHEAKRAKADQMKNLARLMMHGNMAASGAEQEVEMAARNRGRGRGTDPGHPLNKVGLDESRLLGRLARREAADKDCGIMGDLTYCKKKGGLPRRGRSSSSLWGGDLPWMGMR